MFFNNIKAIDNHAHSIFKKINYNRFLSAFSESNDERQIEYHAKRTIFYKRSLNKLIRIFDTDENDYYNQSRKNDVEFLTDLFLKKANLEYLFIDDGYLRDEFFDISFFNKFVKVKRILRIEWLAEQLLKKKLSFEAFLDLFLSYLQNDKEEIVSYKSISAYRCGLDLLKVSFIDAKIEYEKKIRADETQLRSKLLISFLIQKTLEIASEKNIPIQFHTGFGDNDLNLLKSNPLYLKGIIEEFKGVPVVLLHGGYPYTKEAGYLASVYSNVYVDFGLASPFLSVSGIKNTLLDLMELAPWSKILYSSDASKIPELYYLSSEISRFCLHEVLIELIERKEIGTSEYEEISESILRKNAMNLYNII